MERRIEMAHKTEQEEFWSGEFGDEYIKRNEGKELLASNIALFSEILKRTMGGFFRH